MQDRKAYEAPEIEVIDCGQSDVITTSDPVDDDMETIIG